MLYRSEYGVIEQNGFSFVHIKGESDFKVLDIKSVKSGLTFVIKGYTFRILLKGDENVLICRGSNGKHCDIDEALLKELSTYTQGRITRGSKALNACDELLKQESFSTIVDKNMGELAQFSFLNSGEIADSFVQKISKAMAHGAKLRGTVCMAGCDAQK